MQLNLDGDIQKDEIELMVEQYDKLAKLLNSNMSLLMSPIEFLMNRKPGVRRLEFNYDGCILYDKDKPYIVIGDKNLKKVDYTFLSNSKNDEFNFKTRKEYVYDMDYVLSLKGKKLKNLRNTYNKTKNNNLSIEISDDINIMFDIYEEWRKTVGKKYFQIHDTTLHKNYVKYWNKIKDYMILVYLKDGDNYVGFSMFEKTDKDFIYSESRKVLTEYLEYTTFFHIECMKLLQLRKYKYMCDGGADKRGLSFYKQKFDPIIIKTYTLVRKE